MKSYLDILRKLLEEGEWKGNRTGIRTKVLPFQTIEHNMSDGFPLLTTKKVSIKNIAIELEGFLKGVTSKKWFQERGCHIWSSWCNPYKLNQTMIARQEAMLKTHPELSLKEIIEIIDKDKSQIQKEEDDLGPLGYSWQLRRFNQVYDENDNGCLETYDQLKNIVDTLHKNPDDRRMVATHINPQHTSRMALPSCHFAWNLVHINGTLHLIFHIRSNDFFLGNPYNVGSYALLLLLLCKEANLKPGKLCGTFNDCHLYSNHIEQAKLQLTRQPYPLPTVRIPDENWTNIYNWTHKDIVLEDYQCHPGIKAEVAV